MALSERDQKRCNLIYGLGMMYNGESYVGTKPYNKDFNVHWMDITLTSDEDFDAMYDKLKTELIRREKEGGHELTFPESNNS